MSTTLSGHLVESYYRNASLQRARANLPFSQFISNIPSQPQLNRSRSLVISGMSSYLPGSHGMDASMSFSAANMSTTSFDDMSSYMELSEATASRIATLQAKLNQKLGPEYVSQRPGPGGGPKLTYAEGWKIINLANEVFGFNGWSSNIISLTTDYMDTHDEGRRHNVGVTAIVRVTLRDGVFHEDVGYGVIENAKSKGMALDKCKKEAVTDALKRALRNFGNLLGNCLYDKSYAQEVVKIKVPPPKFDKSELYRRPEFQEKETKPDVSKLDAAAASSSTNPGASSNAPLSSSRVGQSVPPAAASATRAAFNPPNHTSAPPNAATPATDIKGKGRAPNNLPSGLNTPDTTPANPMARQNPARGRMPPPPAFNRSVTESNPPHNTHQVPNRMPLQANQQISSHSSNLPLPANNLAQPPVAQPVLAEDELYTMDADESFGMSDDDAFLAVVDLGEGDLGQPIDFDEGTGAKPGLGDDASHESKGTSQDAMPPPQQVPPPQVRFQQPANRASQNTSTNAPEPSRASASNDHSSNHRPQQPINPPKPRSVTPSMGGFHFPPGVTPPIEPPQSQMRTNGQRLTLGSGLLGINRNQPPQRRMPQGMGLSGNQPPDASARSMGAQQQTGHHHQFNQIQRGTKREILGALEVGHDGEVKKPRSPPPPPPSLPSPTSTSSQMAPTPTEALDDGRVGGRIENYTKFWQKDMSKEASVDTDNRLESYTDVVNGYYDGATELYEYGWAQSFHFSRFYKGEAFQASLARHEHYLAHKMGIKAGMRVLDVGCGVGGPAREIAQFTDAQVVGLNNNDFQIGRARKYTKKMGLEGQVSFVKGDFMKLVEKFGENSFDAVYAIEATVHAPSFEGVYDQIRRVLKPGGVFGVYEWVMTEDWDPSIPEHKELAHQIEFGNGIPEMRKLHVARDALKTVGFEIEHEEDLADRPDEVPWYYPLEGDIWKAQTAWDYFTVWRMSWSGKLVTHNAMRVMELFGIIPKGTWEVGESLKVAGDALVKGGQKKLFTPMYLVVSRKPSN